MKQSYWQERIDLARKRGHFTRMDKQRSADWVTCACGKQDPRIPRNTLGSPVNAALRRLGLDFTDAIHLDRFDVAEETLKAIEVRAAEVLAKVGAK